MKILLSSALFFAFSASAFACEPTPASYEKTFSVIRSLESVAYQNELYKLLQLEDVDMTGVDFEKEVVSVNFSNGCEILVTTEWTETDGGGACPEVKDITAEIVCREK